MWESEENHTQRPVYSLVWCEEDRLRVGDRERSPERRAESSWGVASVLVKSLDCMLKAVGSL